MTIVSRAVVSLGILVAAQLLAGFVLMKKMASTVWRESSAAFLMLALGAAIALIGQTYHLADDFARFMFIWMLLSIPIPYLLRANTPAVFYLLGCTVWVCDSSLANTPSRQLIWLLMLPFMPYYLQLLKTARYKTITATISWIFLICFYIWFGIALDKYMGAADLLVYNSLFVITFFIGVLWFDSKEASAWKKPFIQMGFLGLVSTSITLTVRGVWQLLSNHYAALGFMGWISIAAALLFVTILGLRAAKQDKWLGGIACLPVIGIISYCLLGMGISVSWLDVLFNIVFFCLSVGMISKAAFETRQYQLNIGMLLVSAQVLLRFFDMDFSFVARGIVFIIAGAAFFAVNLILVRRKNGGAK
jgi:hypothetical protein